MLFKFILVALAGQGMGFPWGLPRPVKDTQEVAAAKSAHLMAHAAAQDRSWRGAGAEDDGSWKDDTRNGDAQDRSWNGAGAEADGGSWTHSDDGSWKDDTRNGKKSWDAQDRSWNGAEAEDGSWKDDGSWKHYDDGSWKDDTRNNGLSWDSKDRSWNAQDRSWNGAEAGDGSWKDDGSWKHYDDGSWKGDDGSWPQDASIHQESSHEKKWTGPIALPPGYDKHGAPLPVQDTPEVAAEKSKHIHLLARAAAQA